MPVEIGAALISSIIGGLLVALVTHLLTRSSRAKTDEKTTQEIQKLKLETRRLENDLQEQERLNTETQVAMKEVTERALDLTQGKPFPDYHLAFAALEERIGALIERDLAEGVGKTTIQLRLISVAMTFSWENVIITRLPRILKKYDSATLDVALLFVDSEFLSQSRVARDDFVDWVDVSEKQVGRVQSFYRTCLAEYGQRMKLRAATYSNLPHWHGWLVNRDYLILGQTTWEFANGANRLRVGTNPYRDYDNAGRDGPEHIALFESWHDYYLRVGTNIL